MQDSEQAHQHKPGKFVTGPFIESEHREYLETWLKERSYDPSRAENLPSLGLVCFYDKVPAAIIFLRNCENGIGTIDGLTSDPNLPFEIRNQAVRIAVSRLLQICQALNIKQIISFTDSERVIDLSKEFGFSETKHKVICREI